MTCRECPEGRRFAEESVYCVLYGMIIRADHECTRKMAKEKSAGVAAPTEKSREASKDAQQIL